MAHTPLATLHQPGAASEPPLSSFPQHPNTATAPQIPSAAQQQQRVATVGTRSSSLPFHLQMGLNQSKTAPPPPPSPSKGITAAVAGNLKRTFARRRKNSEDTTKLFAAAAPKEQKHEQKLKSGVSSPSLATDRAYKPAPPITAVQLSTPARMETKPHPPVPKAPPHHSPVHSPLKLAPAPPPKDPRPPSHVHIEASSAGSRASVMSTTEIASAVHFISIMDSEKDTAKHLTSTASATTSDPVSMIAQQPEKDTVKHSHSSSGKSGTSLATTTPSAPPSTSLSASTSSTVPTEVKASSNKGRPVSWAESPTLASIMDQQGEKDMVKHDAKENWRKSDSTNSHHTVRPPAGGSSRSSRPVSWAESFHSANTVMQSSTKRRSALISDANFAMPEEDDDEDVPVATTAPSAPATVSTRSRNRRSLSLNLGGNTSPPQRAPTATNLRHPSHSSSECIPPFNAAAPVPHFISNPVPPSPSQHQPPPSPANLRSRLAAWTAASATPYLSVPPSQERTLSPVTPRPAPATTSPSSFRQTAISIGVGPAAAGIARRAADRLGLGRKWGISASSSSSSLGNEPAGEPLARTASNLSISTQSTSFFPSPHRGSHKRTPNATSGAGSFSSGMTSDSDFFAQPTGPILGERLRGAMRSKNGTQIIAGVVFGRSLAAGVRETGIKVGKSPRSAEKRHSGLVGQIEDRMLAAVAARCAQHLLLWGVQEEGLFRVNGRPAHVSKLRSEFDSGADYDMADCSPGDLDPHAVASVFKAYLRELPEPILTQKLLPLFDAAVNKEASKNANEPNQPRQAARGNQGLPSGPKSGFTAGLRKAPSLSTLAMPSFTGIPPPSRALVSTIHTLIKQLPTENRDLLLTIVDLIKATARNIKETKMPLSNLLVVFCPSLNMTPPLLKTLCEVEGVWADEPLGSARAEPVDIPVVIDIRRQTVVGEPKGEQEDEETLSRRRDEESDSGTSSRPSLDNPSSDYHGSAEGSIYEGSAVPRPSRLDYERAEVPTVYMDTRSHISSTSSVSSLLQQEVPRSRHVRELASSDNGSISSGGGSYSTHNTPLSTSELPPLSSSAESVVTPTSSGNPSFTDLHHMKADGDKEQEDSEHAQHTGGGPRIYEAAPLELNNMRQFIGKPTVVPPSPSGVNFPGEPPRRRSIPILSLPGIAGMTPALPASAQASPLSSGPGAESRTLRAKKPSLKLLFSKRSASSLGSARERSASGMAFISAPVLQGGASPRSGTGSGSSSSVSTPVSAVTAPQGAGSCAQFPPVLDTPIEDSPFSFDMGFGISPPPTATPADMYTGPPRSPYGAQSMQQQQQQQQKAMSPQTHPGNSRSRRTIKPGENHIRPQASSSNLSIASTTSSHHLSLFDDDDDQGGMEGWTQSVLLAADMDGKWVVQKPSIKS